jgi:hypothetical protein
MLHKKPHCGIEPQRGSFLVGAQAGRCVLLTGSAWRSEAWRSDTAFGIFYRPEVTDFDLFLLRLFSNLGLHQYFLSVLCDLLSFHRCTARISAIAYAKNFGTAEGDGKWRKRDRSTKQNRRTNERLQNADTDAAKRGPRPVSDHGAALCLEASERLYVIELPEAAIGDCSGHAGCTARAGDRL